MPQIAQQDYLHIKIVDPNNLTDEEKTQIRTFVQNGTIWDAIIEYDYCFSRVISSSPGADSIAFFAPADGEILLIDYSE